MSERAYSRLVRRLVVGLSALGLAVGLVACGTAEDVISFVKYVDGTAAVLEENGLEPALDIDCEGSRETDEVTCTGETTDGRSIESTGENLGGDDATLLVRVDGEILFDGLLSDARS